jgi:site-specific DNA-methyltransferase (adenine-specific)
VFGRGTNIIGGNYVGATHGDGRTNIPPKDSGRFPSNVIFDEEAAKVLDDQSGVLTTGAMTKPYVYTNSGNSMGAPAGQTRAFHEANSGGASRFFYVAKASRAERNLGLDKLEKRQSGMISNTSGKHITRKEEDYEIAQNANFHPTVKPVTLMRYLVTMITPPGGKCVDPFCGSGTTGCACAIEDIEFDGMDNTPEYIEISEARTEAYRDNQLELF